MHVHILTPTILPYAPFYKSEKKYRPAILYNKSVGFIQKP